MPEPGRRSIAKAYRQRVLTEHTGEHRARELENYLISAPFQEKALREPAEIRESVA
jgi:hypothetical protein